LRQFLLRRPNSRKNKRSDVLARPAVSIAVLADGEIRAKQQLCPTSIGGGVQVHLLPPSLRFKSSWLAEP
jgi:hypothetical protein